MTEQEIAERIIRQVTGNKVCSELETKDVEALVIDAFSEVKPWFNEPERVATFPVAKIQERAGSIDFSVLDHLVKRVRYCYPIILQRSYTGDIVRDLLLLPASPLDTRSIIEQTYWEMAWPQVKDLLGRNLRFRFHRSEQRLYVDEVLEGRLTVVWIPEVGEVSHVTYQRALTWIFDMSKALTMEALGNIRGKFRGGALRFETDSDTMLSNAQEKQRELREQLKELQFTLVVR